MEKYRTAMLLRRVFIYSAREMECKRNERKADRGQNREKRKGKINKKTKSETWRKSNADTETEYPLAGRIRGKVERQETERGRNKGVQPQLCGRAKSNRQPINNQPRVRFC